MKDREYHRTYSQQYYHTRRNKIIQDLGGRCAQCGSSENLEIDHCDPSEKQFDIGNLLNHSKEEVERELSKCQLLCHDCHKKKSDEELRERNSGSGNPNFGNTGSKSIFSKPTKCIETGKIFASATEAAMEMNLDKGSVERVCRGDRNSYHGFHFIYVD